MSDVSYRAFVRDFHRRIIENGMSIAEAAQVLNHSPVTIYSWLRFDTEMGGRDMTKIIDIFMNGRYERR